MTQPDLFECERAPNFVPLEIRRGASFSPCGTYRWTLTREWGDGDRVCWILLNPSTADAEQDDPTIRRCINFSAGWGFGSLVLCNLFGLRSTNPRILKDHRDPVGDDNMAAILASEASAVKTVVAWGKHGRLWDYGLEVAAKLNRRPLWCLGVNKDGTPRHPLYVAGDTPLVEFKVTS